MTAELLMDIIDKVGEWRDEIKDSRATDIFMNFLEDLDEFDREKRRETKQ